MSDIEKIIKAARKDMQEMLNSVYNYSSDFPVNEKLLEKILFAMSVIDRKFFVSNGSYLDTALPIGKGQTISQPSTVARMLILADLQEGDEVLEIGTGSGWNTCLIAFLVYPGNVLSLDRIYSLVEKAEKNLSELRSYMKQKKPQDYEKLSKLNFSAGNIFGMNLKRKYDKIIVTAGIDNGEMEGKVDELADSLLKQNGILICPYTRGPMLIYKKQGKLRKIKTREQYVFVPLLEGKE